MKIDSNSQIRGASSTKKKRKVSSGGGFGGLLDSLSEADDAGGASGVASTAPVSALDGMLALQEVSDDEVQRKKAYRQGNLTLDELEGLRMSILLGDVVPAQLHRITERIAQQKLQINNIELQALMHDIEVRAAVELAKMGR